MTYLRNVVPLLAFLTVYWTTPVLADGLLQPRLSLGTHYSRATFSKACTQPSDGEQSCPRNGYSGPGLLIEASLRAAGWASAFVGGLLTVGPSGTAAGPATTLGGEAGLRLHLGGFLLEGAAGLLRLADTEQQWPANTKYEMEIGPLVRLGLGYEHPLWEAWTLGGRVSTFFFDKTSTTVGPGGGSIMNGNGSGYQLALWLGWSL